MFNHFQWVHIEKIIKIILAVLQLIIIARFCGPEQLGVFSVILIFIFLANTFVNSSLDHLFLIDYAKSPVRITPFVAVKMILLAISLPFVLLEENWCFIFVIVFLKAGTLFEAGLQAEMRFNRCASRLVLVYIISMVAQYIGVVHHGLDIYFVLKVMIVESFISFLVSFVLYMKEYKRESIRLFFQAIKGQAFFGLKKETILILKKSLPFIGTGLAVYVYSRIDQLMLIELIGSEANGYYSAASRIIELAYLFPVLIVTSLTPFWAKKQVSSTRIEFDENVRAFISASFFATILVAVLVFLLSDGVVSLLYGSAYSESADILKIMSLLPMTVVPFIFFGKWQAILGFQRYGFYSVIIGVVINICLNFLLIPNYGAQGAASATLASRIVSSFVFLLMPNRMRAIYVLSSIVNPKSVCYTPVKDFFSKLISIRYLRLKR